MVERPPRPEPLPVVFENIPGELRYLNNQWLLWRYVWKEDKGKWDKPPLQPNGKFASSTAKLTWSPFQAVKEAYERGLSLPVDDPLHFDGVGFVPAKVSPAENILQFEDLDKCRDRETGQLSPEAKADLNLIKSYCEISPSGTGIRFIAKGAPPYPAGKDGGKKGGIELYQARHYLTITGHRLEEYPATIELRPEELTEFYLNHFNKSDSSAPGQSQQANSLTDDQIICLASEAVNAKKFMALMDGDINGYPSNSEADLALCNMLAFYTTSEEQINFIFRRSGLYREKWERADYRESTIRKALSLTVEHYSGQARQEPTGGGASLIRLEEVADLTFDKNDRLKKARFSPTFAARAVLEKMPLAMSEESEEIYRFDGQIYRPDGARIIDCELCEAAGDLFTDYQRRETLRRISNQLPNHPVKFDPNPYLLGVKNGAADLLTGVVRVYRHEDFITDQIPVSYDPAARCPAFLAFIKSITPNISDRITLIDWFVATAIKEPLAYVLFLLGLGRNGKGLYEKLLKRFFGQAAFRDMPLSEIGKNNFAAGGFYKKRGWIASETGKRKESIESNFIKLTSGNGVIDSDRKNKSRIQFEPYFQTIVDTNTMPQIDDSSRGWMERFVKVDLPYIFLADPDPNNPLERLRDPGLLDKLTTEAELSGILNLLLFRSKAIGRSGQIHKRPGSEMFAEYCEQSSSVATFLDLFCEYIEDGIYFETPLEPIYEAYREWCCYKVGEVVDIRYFGKQLKNFCGGVEPRRGKSTDRKNIKLYRRLNFDSSKCSDAIEALRLSMSPSVSIMSPSILHEEEEEKKSLLIAMSPLSLWNEIIRQFGEDHSNVKTCAFPIGTIGQIDGENGDNGDNDSKQPCEVVDQRRQDRDTNGDKPKSNLSSPGLTEFKQKVKAYSDRRTCASCGQHFVNPLVVHGRGGYICESCRRSGPPTATTAAEGGDHQSQLGGEAAP